MVNCGENVLGSQFFITLGSNLDSLDGEHCVFGEVVEGEDVLGKLNSTIVDTEGRGEDNFPLSRKSRRKIGTFLQSMQIEFIEFGGNLKKIG